MSLVTTRSINRYFSPEKEILFIAGLHVSYTIANYQLAVLISVFTDGWNMALFYAVCITSIQNGLKKLLVIPCAYIADKYIGCTRMILLSALSYCAGLFVWHFLVGYPDPELTTKPKIPLAWMFLSLILMTLGQSGYDYYKERKPVDSERGRIALLRQNGFNKTGKRQPRLSFCKKITEGIKTILYTLAINRFRIIGNVIATWLIITNFSIAVTLAISLVVLCAGKLCFYPFERPEGSPLSLVFRVLFVAFMRRRYHHTPQGTCQYYYGDNNQNYQQHTNHVQNSEQQLQSELNLNVNVDNNLGIENDGHPKEIELPLVKSGVIDQENTDTKNSYYDDCAGTFNGNQNQVVDNNLDQATDEIIGDGDNDDCDDDNLMEHPNTNNIVSGDNLHYGPGESAGDLEEGEQTFELQNGLTDQLWLLNKAALYDLKEKPEIEEKYKRLCTVNQVKEAKKFLRVTQLSLIFVMYGIMDSVSNTFFVEQAGKMDTSTSYMDVRVQVIMLSSDVTEHLVRLILTNWNLLAGKNVQENRTRFYGATRLGLGMALSVICFTIAFWIEKLRLKALEYDQILSIFWLIPQFSLLGAISGLVVPDEFFDEEMPKSFSRSSYGSILSGGVIGIGRLLSLLMLLIVYTCSKNGSKSGWIGHDIDSSHIDYYYAIMSGFGVVCCIIHGWVTYTYCRHQRSYVAYTKQIK